MHSHLLSHTLEKRMETCTDLRQNQFYWEKSLAIACISNNVLQCMQMMNSLRLQSTNSKMLELGKLLWIYLAFAGCDYIMLCFAYGYVFIYTPRSPQVWTTRVTWYYVFFIAKLIFCRSAVKHHFAGMNFTLGFYPVIDSSRCSGSWTTYSLCTKSSIQ